MQGLGIFSASHGSILNSRWNIGRAWAISHSFWKVSLISTDLEGESPAKLPSRAKFPCDFSHLQKLCLSTCMSPVQTSLSHPALSPSCRRGVKPFHNELISVSHTHPTPPRLVLGLFWAWTHWAPTAAAKTHSSQCQEARQLLGLFSLRVFRYGAAKFQSIC